MKNSLVFKIGGLAFAMCLSQVVLCNAQELRAGEAPLSLDQKALEETPALATPISFEAKRKPLAQLLGDVSKQSGVSLSLVPGSLTGKLVTARVAAMPLFELMGSLARLYGSVWEKTTKGYTLRALPMTRLEQMSLQSAGGSVNVHINWQFMSMEQMGELQEELFDEWMAKNPESFAPMPVSDFSEDVQLRLRRATTQNTWFEIFRAYESLKLLSPDATLSLMRHEDRSMTEFDLTGRAPDARHTLLFDWKSPIFYKKFEIPGHGHPPEPKPEQPQPDAPQQPGQ